LSNIVAISKAIDGGKSISFDYKSPNKDEPVKKYTIVPRWWLRHCLLRLFQAGPEGEDKRLHVEHIQGAIVFE
jgi:hypothetical protein